MKRWLARVHHDLVKYAVWRARDLRDQGGPPRPEDLLALHRGLFDLRDAEGNPASASAVWRELRDEAPPAAAALLGPLSRAVDEAEAAVLALEAQGERPERWELALAVVLALETAYAELGRRLGALKEP